jgi:catechol 2,3-dioxygenase-like lactoylglutathione lyase family enzyme
MRRPARTWIWLRASCATCRASRPRGGGRFSSSTVGGGSFWLKQADPRYTGETFSKDRVGLCEVAFMQIDALARDIEGFGGRILHPPREYAEFCPGYYAVFFADPDGIKLEFAHLPLWRHMENNDGVNDGSL